MARASAMFSVMISPSGPIGDGVFSAEAVRHGKPAPDLFLHAAARMGAVPTRCVVVEDSPAGIVAARAAGMAAIGFTGGLHARGEAYRARLLDAGAEEVAADAAALAALLRTRAGPPAS